MGITIVTGTQSKYFWSVYSKYIIAYKKNMQENN